MRIVPMSRLLIQPTVQLKWIEQHGNIELQLNETDKDRFQQLWQNYDRSGADSVLSFLENTLADDYQLHEDDTLFALLVGADYIQQHHASFNQDFDAPTLVWRIR